MATKTVSITFPTANVMKVTPNKGQTNPELFNRVNIIDVSGVYNTKPATATQEEWAYPYASMTILSVNLKSGHHFKIELQDVSNQATWSTGTQAGLNQAIADIQAWL